MSTSTQPVLLLLLAALLTLSGCGQAQGESPTQEVVAHVLRKNWERTADPKTTLELNSVKFGKPYKATLQEVQVEGLPEGGLVTPAIVDFTVRSFYDRETQLLRRVRESRVYKDKFNEWAVMTGSVRGEDQRSTEPAAK